MNFAIWSPFSRLISTFQASLFVILVFSVLQAYANSSLLFWIALQSIYLSFLAVLKVRGFSILTAALFFANFISIFYCASP